MQRVQFINRFDSLERNRSDMIAMATQVHLRGQGTVGTAHKVDFVVSEPLADVIDVVHAGGGCVETEISDFFEPLAAGANRIWVEQTGGDLFEIGRVAVKIAIERVGSARASLIDKHDIVMRARAKQERIGWSFFCDALARAAAEHEYRFRFVGLEGTKDNDV